MFDLGVTVFGQIACVLFFVVFFLRVTRWVFAMFRLGV